jgi:uncharacterized protein DUF4240
MSFLGKLFGAGEKKTAFEMEPTSEMMSEDQYWKLVADSLTASSNDQDRQLSDLRTRLEKLPAADIVGFRLRTDKLLYDTYNSDMWCAGYIMNGGCSDDGFEYFRLWVISRGREVYENAKAKPDSLISVADTEVPEGLFDLESFWYVANDAFEKKTGKDLYAYIDYDNFKFGEANYNRDLQFTWEEGNPDSMKAICPNLFARFEDEQSASF